MSAPTKTTIIAEGKSDKLALEVAFPRHRIVHMGGIGAEMTPEGIVNRATPFLRVHWNSSNKFVIAIDRETRAQAAVLLAKTIFDSIPPALRAKVKVVLADRMMENWLLADVVSLRKKKYIRRTANQKNYEGRHGKQELQRLFADADYDECIHAPELMKLVDKTVARKNSCSFDLLCRTL